MDNVTLGYESVAFLNQSTSSFIFLYQCSNTAVIVVSEDVACVSLRVYHCVRSYECRCEFSLFMFNLSGSLSKKMNNLLSSFQPGWAV